VINEVEQFTMKKVRMRHELNFKDTVKDDELNECLKQYDKYRNVIDRVLDYYSKDDEEDFDDGDSYDGSKVDSINNAFKKVFRVFGL
jgi:hypothetical protein